MTDKILHKRSGTPGKTPVAGDLTPGELAINTADGRLFTETDSGLVVEFATSAQIGDISAAKLDRVNPVIEGSITEGVFAITGTTPALEPDNGTIQTWTLTGNSSPTDALASGQSMTLMINDGADYTITWPSVVWVGGTAPVLSATGQTVIELWKVGTVLYGALVGSVA